MPASEPSSAVPLGSAFRRCLAAATLSGLGDWITYVALATLAAGGPMRALSVGVVAIAHTLPRVVAAPIAGRLSDRVDRRALLAGAELLRGVAVVGMAVSAARGQIVLVHVFHLVRAGLGAMSETAGRAALPSWVAPAVLGRANRILGVAWSATFAVGVTLGGAVAARVGPVGAFAIDALSFFAAVPIVLSLPAAVPRGRERRGPLPSIVRLLRAEPEVRRAVAVRVPLGFLHGAAFVVSAVRVGQASGAAVEIGLVHGARAIGNIVGSEVALLPFFGVMATPLGAVGATLAMLGLGGPGAALFGSALWGLGMGANWTFGTTAMQVASDEGSLGRVVATDALAFSTAWAVGAAAAVALCEVLALPVVAVSLGAGVMLGWAWLAFPRRARA